MIKKEKDEILKKEHEAKPDKEKKQEKQAFV